ncbi:MAG: SdrD B-like domain-containing protein [Elainellaceae cyanobacterium]
MESRPPQRESPPITPPPVLFDPPRETGLIDAGLGDFVWIDGNGNGLQDFGNGPLDLGESGLNGVRVRLLTLEGELVAETTTTNGPADAPGWYAFEDIDFTLPADPTSPFVPPNYVIEFQAPEGFSFTAQDADPAQYLVGESPIDSDIDPKTGRLETGPLRPLGFPGAQIFTLDAGLVPDRPSPAGEGTVGDRVWLDSNRNGLQDAGEPGINGIDVRLFSENGEFLAETVTTDSADGEAGFYRFDGLQAASLGAAGDLQPYRPGGQYQVEFKLPDNYTFTINNADPRPFIDSESGLDSDVDPATGRLTTWPLTDFIGGFSAVQLNWDAGLLEIDQTLTGSDRPERLRGGRRADHVLGQDGGDRLLGLAGDDVLSGGAGDDTLSGHAGDDVLLGGAGNDRLRGARYRWQDSQEVDTLKGGAGQDLFIIGDRQGSFYTNGGASDQALIVDFVSGEDRIRAFGARDDYRVEANFLEHKVFRGSELVATVYSVFSGALDLAQDFRFIA